MHRLSNYHLRPTDPYTLGNAATALGLLRTTTHPEAQEQVAAAATHRLHCSLF